MTTVLKGVSLPLLALLAVALLLVSAFGPMLDHHFAERYPSHGHLYLGAADSGHSHPFEQAHIHYDAMYAPVPGDEGIVYFSPYDASGHAHADVAASNVPSSPVFDDGDGPLLKSGIESDRVLLGVSVAPPHRPPGM